MSPLECCCFLAIFSIHEVGRASTTDAKAAAFTKPGIKHSSTRMNPADSWSSCLKNSAHRDWAALNNQI
jgi:hypothetical protein